MKPKLRILIASPIDQAAIDRLCQHHDVVCAFSGNTAALSPLIGDREVLVFRSGISVTAELMACAPHLQLIVRAGCGFDNLDLGYIRDRKIQLATVPQPGAQAVAEMAFALMLALARNLREADWLTRQGRWAKHELQGYLLAGKILGIVGTGNIGSRVGELAGAFGMIPIGCVDVATPEVVQQLRQKRITLCTFEEVISRADFLSIHVPLNDSTRNLINARALTHMKRGSFLINLARGGVVDEAALYRELVDGRRLRGAALDVHEQEGDGKISPLASLPNVLLTPHIGAATVDTQREIGWRVVEIIENFCLTAKDQKVRAVTEPDPAFYAPAIAPSV
jgi:D-3-phosphoglycerate dehydrogenase